MASANTSLPVPVSPSSRTVVAVGATWAISSSTRLKRGERLANTFPAPGQAESRR